MKSTENAVLDAALPRMRMGVCVKCPFFTDLHTCQKCHCFMPVKVHLLKAKCPIGKW